MAYVPPVGVINANWPADAYAGARSNITGSWAPGRAVAPVGIAAPAPTTHTLTWQQFIAPEWSAGGVFGAHQAGSVDSYFTPQYQVYASWQGADVYGAPSITINGSWSTSQREIAAAGFDASDVPAPVLLWTQFIAPEGLYRGDFSDPYVLHDYQYAYPEWSIVASWVGAAAYTPPSSEIHGQWRKDFGPKDIAPLGYDGSVVPAPTATLMRAYVEPAGYQHAEFGITQILNGASGISVPGIASRLVFGTPKLDLYTRYIGPSGFYRGAYGRPKAELYRAYLRPSGFDPSSYGVATLSGGLRTISLGGRGIVAGAAGRPTVTFRERLVNAVGWDARALGVPMLGFHTEIQPEGLDAARFGTTEVRDNSQRTYATGRSHDEHGEPFIAMRVRTLLQLPTISPGGMGNAEVRNHRRHIETFSERDDWGPFFGNFAPFVANRNRTVATYGHASAKISFTHTIELGGRALLMAGADCALFGDAMVADAIRTVAVQGYDTSQFSRWAVVVNGARQVAPKAFGQAAIGKPGLANTRRFLNWIGGFDASEFGTAYADFRIRTVEQILPHKPPYAPLPRVFLKQRFLHPSSIDQGGRGVPFIEEKFTRFFPRWVYVDQLGNPSLVNRNRTITTGGYNHEEYGRPSAYLYTRYVQAEGSDFFAISKPRIADTLQKIAVTGILGFRVASGTRVWLYEPDRPYTREIYASGISSPIVVGYPAFRGNSLYPSSIPSAMRAGTPTVHSNGISPEGIYLKEQLKYGRPTLSFDQYIAVTSVAAPNNRQRHRVDPHTIWCTYDTPPQASANHDGNGWRSINSGGTNRFGRPTLRMTGPQAIQAHSYSAASASGSPRVDLRNRYIRPVGIRAFRYGWPYIPGTIHCGPIGTSHGGMGRPNVEHYVHVELDRTLTGKGFSATLWGKAQVELQHRQIYPKGYSAALIPRVQRVGPPLRIQCQGYNADEYGEHWASLFIRHLQPRGFDAHRNGYSIGDFSKRMRVSVVFQARRLVVSGGGFTQMGRPSVGNRARPIGPHNCCCGARMGRPVVSAA